MSYVDEGYVLWPVPPDWGNGVNESLEWLTDVITARNGSAQKRELRQAPRRTFTFDVIAEEQARRVADTLLNDHGSKYFQLPIWHDMQRLGAIDSGTDTIPCVTADYEFAPEARVVFWLSINEWQIAEIETVEADHLVLTGTTERAWPAGTRLYPVRRAHLVDQPEESAWSDASGTRSVQMVLDDYSDWAAVLPTETYLGVPVLEMRPDEGEDPQSAFTRLATNLDVGTGIITLFDWADRAFRTGSMRWLIQGRSEHAALRSLLYGLRGRMQTLWVPTWHSDLLLMADIGSSDTVITVEWTGYTLYGRMQSNRRDIRIELLDGTIWYRRITDAAEAGDTEQLTLASALGEAVTRQQVRCISFMVLCDQAHDRVELQHHADADGITSVATQFRGVRHDL